MAKSNVAMKSNSPDQPKQVDMTANHTDSEPNTLGNVSSELMEHLADIEHERWSSWMRWLFDPANGGYNEDGSFTIKPSSTRRWSRLAATPYKKLDEETKEYDRIEVRKTLEALPSLRASDGSGVDAKFISNQQNKELWRWLPTCGRPCAEDDMCDVCQESVAHFANLIQSERLKAKREVLKELRHSIDEAYSPKIFGHLDDLQGCLDCTAAAGARLTLNFIDSRLAELDSLDQ